MKPKTAVEKLAKNLKAMKTYGAEAVLRTHLETLLYMLDGKSGKLVRKLHDSMSRRLLPVFEEATKDFPEQPETGEAIRRDAPIWIMWWQGPEQYPELVRRMVANIRRLREDHPVIELSRENIREYVELPEHIWKKLDCGILPVTHFSDIARTYLIWRWGGIWIDATLLMTAPLPEAMYELPFYTIRRSVNNHPYVSRSRWTTYFLAGGKGCMPAKYTCDFLLAYWRRYDRLLDYAIMDYALRMGDERLPWLRDMVDAVPCGNEHVRDLAECLNEPFDADAFARMCADTTLFKLSRKDPCRMENGGRKTYWAYVSENILV